MHRTCAPSAQCITAARELFSSVRGTPETYLSRLGLLGNDSPRKRSDRKLRSFPALRVTVISVALHQYARTASVVAPIVGRPVLPYLTAATGVAAARLRRGEHSGSQRTGI